MASIVLSVAGRVVGTAIGGPIGGQIGATLGASVGGQFGGTTKSHYEGARLENLAVQTSTYGRMIPMVYGTVRIAGNVIWARPIKEVETSTTVSAGGKGGGGKKSKSTSKTFSYFSTLAIAICEGEITRVNRVWADAKLLDLSQGTYRMYTGGEDQLPDALIESFQGVGSTPAYRGMAYVVIEDFPLGDFGNRIPNFTFEVTRHTPQCDSDEQPVEDMVRSVMLIPGSGEFVYDAVAQYKITGSSSTQQGFRVPLNQHTVEGKANMLVALDQMQETFPNLEWVGVAVNWFGTTMNVNDCEIFPCVEYKDNVATDPNAWNVAGYVRSTAREIGYDDGKPRYGGTPDDGSIARLLDELQTRGINVFFYPMMLMDISGKPWRGNLAGSAGDVSNFFTRTHGYNNFILHYANLVAGKVDAFAIGTEMRDLTAITSGSGVFPAVDALVSLAASVKTILGSDVVVTYAADWSEYHHTNDGWYNLDALWASPDIDVVGIDAYFPLSDAVQTGYDIDALRDGWTSGEGYDFYYSDEDRTVQAPLDPPYAWKNIAWWWSHTHTNPDSSTSDWVPESKPIWFTEYGFPSVDGCANQPNVFIDETADASAYPRFSRGRIDFMAQRVAIAATEAEWADSDMVQNKFLWTWDARPYPYWPDLREVWSDGTSWSTGHWVQGKLGASHVAAVVEEIAQHAGLPAEQIDTDQLQLMLEGFVVAERTSARAVIEQLMQAYFFSLHEQEDTLIALPRDASIDAEVDASQCVNLRADDREVSYMLSRQEDLSLPGMLEIHYLNRLLRYETHVQTAMRASTDANDIAAIKVSLVLSETHARTIVDTALADLWAARSQVSLQLPARYATLQPNDLIGLTDGDVTHRSRVQQVQWGKPGLVRIKAVVDAAETWDGYIAPLSSGGGEVVAPPAVTQLQILDIPALPGDTQDALTLRFAACGISQGWGGASIVREMPSGEDEILADIDKAAVMGACLSALGVGAPYRLDLVNSVDVALLGEGSLASVTDDVMLTGANVGVIGDEIIQFATATALGDNTYRLSRLLRGRLGTESKISGHSIGDRFVLLNDAIVSVVLTPSAMGQEWELRAPTVGTSLSSGTPRLYTIQAASLKPYAPVQLEAWRSGADVVLRWKRRARIDGGLRDTVDIPLMEQSELYDVKVMDGSTVKRTWRVDTSSIAYTAAEQTADFGSPPDSFTLWVSQLSALVGQGEPASALVTVS